MTTRDNTHRRRRHHHLNNSLPILPRVYPSPNELEDGDGGQRVLPVLALSASPASVAKVVIIIGRQICACLVLSAAGIFLRSSLNPDAADTASITRDAAAVVLENHLILSIGRRVGDRNWKQAMAGGTAARVVLFLLWFVATVGDYTYQVQTGGGLPSLADVQVGLKNPWMYVSDQMAISDDSGLAFLRVVLRVAAGPVVVVLCHYYLIPHQRNRNTASARRRFDYFFRVRASSIITTGDTSAFLLDSPTTLLCCLLLLACLYRLLGAWAPVSNLIWCSANAIFYPPVISVASSSLLTGTRTTGTNTSFGRSSNYGWWNASALSPISMADDSQDDDNHHSRPNVIIIVHESLSGSAMYSTRGERAAPFWHGTMRSNPNVYQFSNVLAASGMTSIATAAILTGLVVYDEDSLGTMRSSMNMAADLKGAGYDTACFSSYGTDFDGTYWAILNELYNNDFDSVYGPEEMGDPIVNMGGIDDRRTVGHFKDWVENGRNGAKRNNSSSRDFEETPFFAVLVFNNNHYPFLKHETYKDHNKKSSGKVDRYFSSLRTTDESIKAVFDVLGEISEDNDHGKGSSAKATRRVNNDKYGASLLDNTIVMGAGDHGETPGPTKRIHKLDAPILHVPMYMHIPQKLFLGKREMYKSIHLSRNGDRATSTLDLIPTLRDILGFPLVYTTEQTKKCLTGRSLLSSLVPVDRVVQAWQGPPLLLFANIAVFATSTEIFVISDGKPKVSLRNVSDTDPFNQKFNAVPFSDIDNTQKEKWFSLLNSWMGHPYVTDAVKGLREVFNLTVLSDVAWVDNRWKDLGQRERSALKSLGYDELGRLWDMDDFWPTEILRRDWDDFTEEGKRILRAMGYSGFVWENDRPQDSWTEDDWEDINPKIVDILTSLGFTQEDWDEEIYPYDLLQRSWDSFNCEQQWLQVSMEYNKKRWDRVSNSSCVFDQRFYEKLST